MTDLTKYMELQYRSGARGEDGFIDCWGLSRIIRFKEFGKSLLPSFSQARHGVKGSIQQAYGELAEITHPGPPDPGSIAAVLRKGMCVHVAVVVDQGQIIEIRRAGHKPRIFTLGDWLREYPAPMWEVKFHD